MHREDTTARRSGLPEGAIGVGRIAAGALGALKLAWSDAGIVRLGFVDMDATSPRPLSPVPPEYADALRRYLSGDRDVDPASLPIDYAGQGTPKQRKVWDALRTIPRGEVRSYAWLARQVRSIPRAVGQANKRNPIAIVVPCHRVIDADDTLGGYGGGRERKVELLELEGLSVEGEHVTRGQLTLV